MFKDKFGNGLRIFLIKIFSESQPEMITRFDVYLVFDTNDRCRMLLMFLSFFYLMVVFMVNGAIVNISIRFFFSFALSSNSTSNTHILCFSILHHFNIELTKR